MATDLNSIKQTLVNITKQDSILEMLMEFERTLDNAEVFAYKNWLSGELVDGPHIGRYWFKVVFMYPYSMMPDPMAGLRLTKLGAKVNFRRGKFAKPVKVRGPQDWKNPDTKQAKLAHHKIWLVSIDLPLKYINRGIQHIDDIIELDIDKTNEEIANAYDEEQPDDQGLDPTLDQGFDQGLDQGLGQPLDDTTQQPPGGNI